MTSRLLPPLVGSSAARIFASPVGPRIALDMPDRSGSWGERLVADPAFRTLAASPKQTGTVKVNVPSLAVEMKSITSVAGSGAAMVAPDATTAGVTMLPWRRPTVRSLVAPGRTVSRLVYYGTQTSRTNGAAPAAEGTTKGSADLAIGNLSTTVRTLAEVQKASRQALDDSALLQSLIDAELRSALADVEERQLLSGDGTGENLLGLIPQATAFAAPFAIVGATSVDVLLQAIAQSETSLLPVSGIVLNATDWRAIQASKDGTGRYLIGDPVGDAPRRLLWDIPVVPTFAMPSGRFLVGPFQDGAQIFDRQDATIEIATENEADFSMNLISIRAEERLAFAVRRPSAFVVGSLV